MVFNKKTKCNEREEGFMKIITKYFYPNRVEITERRTTTNEVESIKEWGKSVCARFYKTKRGEDAMSYNRITYVFPRE